MQVLAVEELKMVEGQQRSSSRQGEMPPVSGIRAMRWYE